jgi:hypothetical protein
MLCADLNLSEFGSNLSLSRTEEHSNISGCSNVTSVIVLIHVKEYSDDHEEKNNIDMDYLSEVET